MSDPTQEESFDAWALVATGMEQERLEAQIKGQKEDIEFLQYKLNEAKKTLARYESALQEEDTKGKDSYVKDNISQEFWSAIALTDWNMWVDSLKTPEDREQDAMHKTLVEWRDHGACVEVSSDKMCKEMCKHYRGEPVQW